MPHTCSRSKIHGRAIAAVCCCCLVLAACAAGDEAGSVPQVELRDRLSGADVADEVADCVVQLAADELRRGSLDTVMEEELVASCERAQEVLDRSDAEPDGVAGGEPSGRGLAFGEDGTDEQPVGYGSDPYLDRLWEGCEAGDGEACDRLFERSPVGSEYEQFGLTCGNRDRVLDCRELGLEAGTS